MRPACDHAGRLFLVYNIRNMFCIECGQDNLTTAKFCRKCGAKMDTDQRPVALAEIEEETRVAVREPAAPPVGLDDGRDTELFSIGPTLMFVKIGYVLAAVGAVFLVALISAFFGDFVSVTVAIVLGFLLFLIPAYHHIKKKLVRYRLTESQLEIDEGFISRTTRNVPIRRIQDVTVSATATQRLFGYGDLMIDNASDEGGKVVLKNINSPREYADMLLRQMKRIER